MKLALSEGQERAIIFALLAAQIAILLASLEQSEISPFCTVPIEPEWTWVGYIHGAFLVLLMVGAASLAWRRARLWYAMSLLVCLCVLPVQASLVADGKLGCDYL